MFSVCAAGLSAQFGRRSMQQQSKQMNKQMNESRQKKTLCIFIIKAHLSFDHHCAETDTQSKRKEETAQKTQHTKLSSYDKKKTQTQ